MLWTIFKDLDNAPSVIELIRENLKPSVSMVWHERIVAIKAFVKRTVKL